ncbi:hypothetical protein HMPREF1508_0830 [Shuttleworthella sp. MSX8B]|nr:hypothetical protein HMPREF1508_0830 [Shuttleworthia sp. MSX8B]
MCASKETAKKQCARVKGRRKKRASSHIPAHPVERTRHIRVSSPFFMLHYSRRISG